jgi:putative hydrolase of the HAD superfamily
VLHRLDHDAAWEPLLDELYAAFSRAEVWRAFPDTRPALSALTERGVTLAVISNWDRRLPRILDDLELTGFFATITVSSVEGVEKPDPEIFRRTLDRLGIAPNQALHVGDSPRDDCQAAAQAGLQTVLIDRYGLFPGEPWRRITSLAELLDFVL